MKKNQTKSSARNSLRNNQGQLSIFLAITVVFFITAIAFVINIGLFVKAKINLQNAVDAGAFAGAAVQSRQLTDIAYLNWEMRNTYKEWMFKYYVLGNLNVPGVENPDISKPGSIIPTDMMDFTVGNNNADQYNVPSVCIQLGEQQYCRIYKVPGIPRMSNQIVGVQELANFQKDFIDRIAEKKLEKCAEASQINFQVARRWAFGMGSAIDSFVANNIPNIGGDRPGAFPKAVELALRIRNLEAIVNRRPVTSKIDEGEIQQIITQNRIDNERTVKAFYSAWRNLGGEKNKELKETFTMSEIDVVPPTITGGEKSLSFAFIPSNAVEARQKRYLDLRLYSINYATFFTALSPKPELTEKIDATCEMTKIAIPVPAYPLGFEKNSNVMTYYAIKGEATFNGLFNPLKGQIPLTAYAMAKPFGGRIGPKLFKIDGSFITSRTPTENAKNRSSPYIFGMEPGPTPSGTIPAILPALARFWVQDPNEPIGGDFGNELPKFVIPNMHYDIDPGDDRVYHSQNTFVMQAPTSSQPYPIGLYDRAQFKKFSENLTAGANFNGVDQVTNDDVKEAIQKVRLPTPYEARNYLIPSTNALNSAFVPPINSYAFSRNRFELFAPLYGSNFLYLESKNIQDEVKEFVIKQKPSIDQFVQTMKETKEQMLALPAANDPDENFSDQAADIIHNDPLTCTSIAGQFAYYYLGKESGITENEGCPDPFAETLTAYFDNSALIKPEFYIEEEAPMIREDANSERFIFSAYAPGSSRGFDPATGESQNPFSKRVIRDLRNFYSTKFISFESYRDLHDKAGLYSEGGKSVQGSLANPLESSNIPIGEIYR